MGLLDFFRQSKKDQAPAAGAGDTRILASLLVLAWVVEARDPYTGGHLWRVSRFAKLLAEKAGLPEDEVARITIAGFLHDLGKISIPDAILGKTDKLTDAEYEVIKTHPEAGQRMLAGHPFSALAMDAVLLHHERPDGKGYPYGKSGEDVPLAARIVGICDAFDAMTSSRPYRKGMPIEKALSIIQDNLAGQFDAHLGQLFVALGAGQELAHIVGHSDEGIPLECCLMCGPIIVRPSGAKPGDMLYCPACHSQYRIDLSGKGLQATGQQDRAQATKAVPDARLIDRLVDANLPALA